MADAEKDTNTSLLQSPWRVERIELEPDAEFDSWICFEVQLAGRMGRTRHLAGTAGRYRHGRVSSAVIKIDPLTRLCVSASGRVYKLGQHHGLEVDADYTWKKWLNINNASAIVLITSDVEELLMNANANYPEKSPKPGGTHE